MANLFLRILCISAASAVLGLRVSDANAACIQTILQKLHLKLKSASH